MTAVELLAAPQLSPGAYAAPRCSGSAGIRSGLACPVAFDLWVVDAVLPTGAELQWDRDHGDEAIAVLTGAVEIGGEDCPVDTVIVVEAGALATLRASEPATVVHFGGAHQGARSRRDGRLPPGVHVIGPGPATGTRVAHPEGMVSAGYYLDSTCAGCDLTLLRTTGEGTVKGSSHSHSQHELIRVLDGALHFGPLVATAGTTAAIPADLRYAFRATARFAFLNYRAGPSTITKQRRPGAVRESADSLGWGDLGTRHVRISINERSQAWEPLSTR